MDEDSFSQIFVEDYQVIEDVDDLLVPIEPQKEIEVAKKRTAQVNQTTIPTKRRIVRKFQIEDVLTEKRRSRLTHLGRPEKQNKRVSKNAKSEGFSNQEHNSINIQPPPAVENAAKKDTSVLKLDTEGNSNDRPLIKVDKNLFLNNPQLLMSAKVMVERTFLSKNVKTIKVKDSNEPQAHKNLVTPRENGLKTVTIPKLPEPAPLNLLTIKEEVVVEPPVTKTAQNLDPNCEIVGDMLICRSCNLYEMKPSNHKKHIKSRLHRLLLKFPLESLNRNANKGEDNASKEETYKCLICNKNFLERHTYVRHCAQFHNDEDEKIDLNCKLCSKEFPNPNDLNIHYVTDHDIKAWQFMSSKMLTCQCGEVVQRKVFRHHQKTKHTFTGLCNICGKNFSCVKKFKKHRDTAHKEKIVKKEVKKEVKKVAKRKRKVREKKLICEICGYRSAQINKMRLHMPKHDPNRVKRICCEFCGYRCDRGYSFKRHMWRVHGVKKTEKICMSPVQANFHCDICDKMFAHSSYFETHLKSVDHRKKLVDMKSETKIEMKIEEDEYSTDHEYNDEYSLDIEESTNMSENFNINEDFSTEKNRHQRPMHVCDCCNKTFDKKSSLESHVKCHKTQIVVPHVIYMPDSKCLICNINFPSQGDYVAHCASLHIKSEDFGEDRLKLEPEIDVACKVCSRDFFDANELNVHYVMDHEVKAWPFMSDKMLTCHCGEVIHRNKFKIHHRNKHPAIFLCDVCMKEFDSIYKLNRHRFLFHKEKCQKTVTCDICGCEYEDISRLRKHMVSHDRSRLRKVKCDLCSYRCDYPNRMVTHNLKNHGVVKTAQEFYERKEPVYPYKCDLCDRKYKSSSTFRLHLKSKDHQDKIEA